MKCRQCGNIIPPDTRYCPYCGVLIASAPEVKSFNISPQTPIKGKTRLPLWAIYSFGFALLALAIGAGIQFWPTQISNPSSQSSYSENSYSTPSNDSAVAGWTIIRTNNAGNIEYYAREPDGSTTRIIVGTPLGEVNTPISLPNGLKVFTINSPERAHGGFNKETYLINTNGQNQRMISSHSGFPSQGLAVSPDGTQIAYIYGTLKGSTLRIIDINGNLIKQFDFFWRDSGLPTSPSWSPGGKLIAFCISNELGSYGYTGTPSENGGIYTVDVNNGTIQTLTNIGKNPSWTPDSTEIIFVCYNVVYKVQIDNRVIKQIGHI